MKSRWSKESSTLPRNVNETTVSQVTVLCGFTCRNTSVCVYLGVFLNGSLSEKGEFYKAQKNLLCSKPYKHTERNTNCIEKDFSFGILDKPKLSK